MSLPLCIICCRYKFSVGDIQFTESGLCTHAAFLTAGGARKAGISALKLAVHSFPSKIHKVGRAFRSSEVQQTEDEHLPFSSHTLDSSMSTLCQIQAPRGQLSYLELAVFFLRVQLGASEMHGLFSYWARYCDN